MVIALPVPSICLPGFRQVAPRGKPRWLAALPRGTPATCQRDAETESLSLLRDGGRSPGLPAHARPRLVPERTALEAPGGIQEVSVLGVPLLVDVDHAVVATAR